MEFKFSFFEEDKTDQEQQRQPSSGNSDQAKPSTSSSCNKTPIIPAQILNAANELDTATRTVRTAKAPLQVWVIPAQVKLLLSQTRDVGLQSLQGTGLDQVVGETDVHKGAYEGGFKLWECSVDVARYIHSKVGKPTQGFRVLDLGCGHGVPGVFLLKQGFARSVMFQDLNREVLLRQTIQNVQVNCGDQAVGKCVFVSGDWRDFQRVVDSEKSQFDLIVTAETVYDVDQFDALHRLFDEYLAAKGTVLVAAKRFYFGVGGGSHAFKDYVQKKMVFSTEIVEEIVDGSSNVRDIILLKRR